MDYARNFTKNSLHIILSLVLFVSLFELAWGWTEPTLSPPGGNVSAPINTGATTQSKSGSFSVLGSFGIGTASPGKKIEIQGGANDGAVIGASSGFTQLIYQRANVAKWSLNNNVTGADFFNLQNEALGSSAISVNSTNNNVGIGITSPGAKLHVGTAGTQSAYTYSASNGDGLLFNFYNDSSPYMRHADIVSSAGDTSAADMKFFTKAASASPLERVRIDSTGNVGIGTASPGSLLDVTGSTPAITISDNGAGASARNWRLQSSPANWGSFAIQQSTTKLGSTYASKLSIDENGNVGIGTISPAVNLQVVGASHGQVFKAGYTTYTVGLGISAGGVGYAAGLWNNDTLQATFINRGLALGSYALANNPPADTLIVDNVGIGTSAPGSSAVTGLGFSYSAVLHINGSARPSPTFSGAGVDFRFIDTNALANVKAGDIVYDDQIFKFRGLTDAGAVKNDPTLSVDTNNGRVGISTAAPIDQFHLGYNGNNSMTIGLQASGGSTSHIKFLPSNSQTNWQISNNEYFLGALEFTPSTVGGGSTFTTPTMYLAPAAGTVSFAAWSYNSDRRLKENISYFDSGLSKITQLQPAQFDYISGEKNQVGFIAQDVQKVIPEAVTVSEEKNGSPGMLSLKTDFLVPYLVNSTKELNVKIETQQNKIDELEARLSKLEAQK